MKITSYKQAKEYLEGFIKPTVFRKIELQEAEKHDPLERMRVFLKLLGNPQNKFRSIQASGTSGKGSTAYYISHILAVAGYTVGFSMSPHLIKINERIQISTNHEARITKHGKKQLLESISDEEFVELLNQMVTAIEKVQPSYFEITMAMGFLFFAKKKVDIAVVEVGIEGRYDASNVLNPIATVLTNIDLDHTDILGETVEEIAREAVSIIKNEELRMKNYGLKNQKYNSKVKSNQIVVTGVKQSTVVKIVEQTCNEKNAELFRLGKDFRVKLKRETTEGSIFDFFSKGVTLHQGYTLQNIFVSMLGSYQIENAGIAIEAVLELEQFGFKISEKHIRVALKTAFFPGRFEVVHSSPLRLASFTQGKISIPLILDGAHNPIKMRSFISSLNKLYPRTRKIFIAAFKGNKDTKGMLTEIVKAADVIIATQFDAGSIGYVSTGAADVGSIKDEVSGIVKNAKLKAQSDSEKLRIYEEKDSKRALKLALRHSGPLRQSASEASLSRIRSASLRLRGSDSRSSGQVDSGVVVASQNDIIVVTGSLYLVGELRGYLKS